MQHILDLTKGIETTGMWSRPAGCVLVYMIWGAGGWIMDVSREAEGSAIVWTHRWDCVGGNTVSCCSAGVCILEAKENRECMELGNVFGLGVSQYYVLGVV